MDRRNQFHSESKQNTIENYKWLSASIKKHETVITDLSRRKSKSERASSVAQLVKGLLCMQCPKFISQHCLKLATEVRACNPSTWDVRAEWSRVQGHLQLNNTSGVCIRHCLKKQKERKGAGDDSWVEHWLFFQMTQVWFPKPRWQLTTLGTPVPERIQCPLALEVTAHTTGRQNT